MSKNPFLCILFGVLVFFSLHSYAQMAAPNNAATFIKIDGAIGPSTADFVHRSLKKANESKASLFILELNTPGGLDKSMRTIVSDILDSPIPIICYVAPSGARAASAGTFILYACHVAAMAPGTNIGAATPVSIGFGGESEKDKKPHQITAEEQKVLNDARAYIRSLAQLRGRNVTWAEQAITQGASLSAIEALKLKVIDLIAPNLNSLLSQLDGRKVTINNQEIVLNTENLQVTTINSDWRSQFLAVITDPNIAYILLLIGIYGLFFEFFSPGFVLPGVAGVISLLLALYAFQLLPINYAGLGLILFGIAFLVAEAFVPSYGSLGIGGIIAFIIGSIMLLSTDVPGFQIALSLIATVSVVTAIFFLFILNMAIRARFRPAASGSEQLINKTAIIQMDSDTNPRIRILGELWQVNSDTPLSNGQIVKIVRREGLTLWVQPIKKE